MSCDYAAVGHGVVRGSADGRGAVTVATPRGPYTLCRHSPAAVALEPREVRDVEAALAARARAVLAGTGAVVCTCAGGSGVCGGRRAEVQLRVDPAGGAWLLCVLVATCGPGPPAGCDVLHTSHGVRVVQRRREQQARLPATGTPAILPPPPPPVPVPVPVPVPERAADGFSMVDLDEWRYTLRVETVPERGPGGRPPPPRPLPDEKAPPVFADAPPPASPPRKRRRVRNEAAPSPAAPPALWWRPPTTLLCARDGRASREVAEGLAPGAGFGLEAVEFRRIGMEVPARHRRQVLVVIDGWERVTPGWRAALASLYAALGYGRLAVVDARGVPPARRAYLASQTAHLVEHLVVGCQSASEPRVSIGAAPWGPTPIAGGLSAVCRELWGRAGRRGLRADRVVYLVAEAAPGGSCEWLAVAGGAGGELCAITQGRGDWRALRGDVAHARGGGGGAAAPRCLVLVSTGDGHAPLVASGAARPPVDALALPCCICALEVAGRPPGPSGLAYRAAVDGGAKLLQAVWPARSAARGARVLSGDYPAEYDVLVARAVAARAH